VPSTIHRASIARHEVDHLGEALAHHLGGLQISLVGGLGVDGQGQSGVRVSEPDLGRLEVDPTEHRGGGGETAQIVESGARDTRCVHCRLPDPSPEVHIRPWAAPWGREDEGLDVSRRWSEPCHVSAQDVGEDHRHGQRSDAGRRFGWPEDVLPVGVPGHDLGHVHGPAEQVEAAHPEASDLTPAEPEERADPDHCPITLIHRRGQYADVFWGEPAAFGRPSLGQLHVPARRTANHLGGDGVGEGGSKRPIGPADGPRRHLLAPRVHELLDVALTDAPELPGTDGRKDVATQG
jgi:hypothetical protein